MKLFSFDDNEPGIIAFGGAPVGVIAIGSTPVGVIAIGFGAVGVVSVSCGAAAGGLTIVCGVGAGIYAVGCGAVLGIKSTGVGFEGNVIPEEPYPRADDAERHAYERRIGRAVPDWLVIHPTKDDAGRVRLIHDDEPIELGPDARKLLDTFGDDDLPVRVRVSKESVPAGTGEGYRTAPATKTALRADELELPPPKRLPPSFFDRVWWIGGTVLKAVVFAAVAIGVGVFVSERLGKLGLVHTAELSWTGTISRKEGISFSDDSSCTVVARLRGDGADRAKVESVHVACGSLTLFPANVLLSCPVQAEDAVTCSARAVPPDDDSSGHPALELVAGGEVKVVQSLPAPFSVTIALDPKSLKRSGEVVLKTPKTLGGP